MGSSKKWSSSANRSPISGSRISIRCETPRSIGDPGRPGGLVVARIRETDAEGAGGAHVGDDERAVDTPRKESTQWHVTHQLALHGAVDLVVHRVEPLLGGEIRREYLCRRYLPPSLLPSFAAFGVEAEQGARVELLNPGEQRRRSRHVLPGQELGEAIQIHPRLDQARGEQGFHLRAEDQMLAGHGKEHRLDAETVPHQNDTLLPRVVQGDGEHPVQEGRELLAMLLPEMGDDLTIRRCREAVPLGLESTSQLAIVVDLPIEDQTDRPVFVEQRLVSTGQVDDGKSAHAEADPAFE